MLSNERRVALVPGKTGCVENILTSDTATVFKLASSPTSQIVTDVL